MGSIVLFFIHLYNSFLFNSHYPCWLPPLPLLMTPLFPACSSFYFHVTIACYLFVYQVSEFNQQQEDGEGVLKEYGPPTRVYTYEDVSLPSKPLTVYKSSGRGRAQPAWPPQEGLVQVSQSSAAKVTFIFLSQLPSGRLTACFC